MKTLLIEEEMALGEAIALSLRTRGHTVEWARAAASYQSHCGGKSYDVIVLDAKVSGANAIDMLRWLRKNGIDTPTLVLCADQEVEYKIKLLDAGADDYMVKPVNLREFEARMRALVRRHGGLSKSKGEIGDVVLDTATRSISMGGKSITLTRREFRLLELLTSRLDNVIPKERLMDQLFGYEEDVGPNAVELYVSRIRQKLRETSLRIDTVRSVGYMAKLKNCDGSKLPVQQQLPS